MADEAKECGLVNEVYDSHEAMLEAANAMAKEIASKSPIAIYGLKRSPELLSRSYRERWFGVQRPVEWSYVEFQRHGRSHASENGKKRNLF